jgi:diaminopimelate decarboxylase
MHRDATVTIAHAPHAFAVEGDQLLIGGQTLSSLAARVGRTPFYAYDRSKIDLRVRELRNVLPAGVKLHYAIKANPMPVLVDYLAQRVDGLDVASAGELQLALDTGFDVREISFAGPGKSVTELEQAAAAGILINVESAREVRELVRIAEQRGEGARVAVRVNPDFELKSSGMKMGGGAKPFGVDVEQVPALLRQIGQSGLRFEGFHIFSGSQSLRAEAICESQGNAFELALKLAVDAPSPVRVVNIGGGFGIPYFPGERPLDLAPMGETTWRDSTSAASANCLTPNWCSNSAAILVGEAGVYVCRVVDRKLSRGQVFLVTDGGLHHHLAASGNFGQVVRKNYPVAIGNRMGGAEVETATVVGPLCTPFDLLAERMALPPAREGDLVVVFQSGAYGYSASPHRFLSHPAPAEIFV